MSVCNSSTCGQKLRLNLVALLNEGSVAKQLVLIDEEALVEDLANKVRATLTRCGVEGHLLRLTNDHQAHLPYDERVGDVLRDTDEVVAVLTQSPEDPAEAHQLAGGVGNIMSFSRTEGPQVAPQMAGTLHTGPVEVFEDDPDRPGPKEAFEEDLKASFVGRYQLPQPISDWNVEGLTPKLREYISTRFRDVPRAASMDPTLSFITVTMRPHDRAGSINESVPVHYSIARIDVIEFERLCGRKIEEARTRLDYFQRSREGLQSLVDRGAGKEEYSANMVPYKYRADEEFESLISETDAPIFGQVEGFRPVILMDTSGPAGDAIVYIRAALKKMLYSFIVAKSKFNLVKFSGGGRPVAWEPAMVPPSTQKLKEAELFFDSLQAHRKSVKPDHWLEGLLYALALREVDVIYVLSAGLPKGSDVDYILRDIRLKNIRGIPIHVIGIDCESRSELDLRRLAEENNGIFRHKSFDPGSQGIHAGATARASWNVGGRDGDYRLTVGGQLDIIEIMTREQELQRNDWLEEQKCANRLLLTTATQQAVPPVEQRQANNYHTMLAHATGRPPTLREMLDPSAPVIPHMATAGAGPAQLGTASGYSRTGVTAGSRRGLAQPAQNHRRSSSQQRRLSGSGVDKQLHAPSIANPWDAPSRVVRMSQQTASAKGCASACPSATPGASRRSNSPGSVTGQSSRRANSARRRG